MSVTCQGVQFETPDISVPIKEPIRNRILPQAAKHTLTSLRSCIPGHAFRLPTSRCPNMHTCTYSTHADANCTYLNAYRLALEAPHLRIPSIFPPPSNLLPRRFPSVPLPPSPPLFRQFSSLPPSSLPQPLPFPWILLCNASCAINI